MSEIRLSDNDFSFWFPKIKDCGINVPKTFYAKLPPYENDDGEVERLYRAFYMDSREEDMDVIERWVEKDIIPELKQMDLTGHLFVKNARFSNKFDANGSCNIYGVRDLARAISRVNYGALCCGADGIDEIVVRKFIEYNSRETPCIYNGLPLRSEFRVFYDFDSQSPIFTVDYWDFDYVYPHLYDATDRIVFEHEKGRLEKNYLQHWHDIQDVVSSAMKNNVNGLTGHWSIDILLDESNTLWLIDMAIAQTSAYWENRPNKEWYK